MECVEFFVWNRFYYRVCSFRGCLHRLHLISGGLPKFPPRLFAHTFAAHVQDRHSLPRFTLLQRPLSPVLAYSANIPS